MCSEAQSPTRGSPTIDSVRNMTSRCSPGARRTQACSTYVRENALVWRTWTRQFAGTGSGLLTLTNPVSREDGEDVTEMTWVWLDCASLLSRVISPTAGLIGSWYSAIRATTQ